MLYTLHKSERAGPQKAYLQCVPWSIQPAEFAIIQYNITLIQICMMSQEHDKDNPIDKKAAINHGGNKLKDDPLERMLAMKNEQISELKNDLAKKETQMDKREKEAREEFSKKEKELREVVLKKDQEWMDTVEELRGQLGKGDNEVDTCMYIKDV